ncbi:MAG: ribbon-helix-helix domain-containing protein [Clostridium sp.]
MANKQLKNRIPLGSAVDKELAEELRKHSKETGIPISKLLDKSISLFLESTKK